MNCRRHLPSIPAVTHLSQTSHAGGHVGQKYCRQEANELDDQSRGVKTRLRILGVARGVGAED